MTAVEYLIEVFFKSNVEKALFQDEINKAKEMEKEQIISAFDKGLITENIYYGYDDKKAEQYYNETFKNNKL